ncbi:ribonuclease domain-containing protein [Spirosoma sp. SC4-14]|uniref:ribonuclease domain-containing protein n=1 Tax=Spirosoma sp. SC4-14 TaxID=3128900 RepID=UPI0030CA739B
MHPYFLRSFWQFWLLIIVVFAGLGCRTDQHNQSGQPTFQQQQQQNNSHRKHKQHKKQAKTDQNRQEPSASALRNQGTVPDKVLKVLEYVRRYGRAPDGYVGGRTFGNFEGHLPKQDASGQRIRYQEWDVNPKIQGKNRGTERLITGSDNHAYYTQDHYNSFTEIK